MINKKINKTILKLLTPTACCLFLVIPTVSCSLEIIPDPETDINFTISYCISGEEHIVKGSDKTIVKPESLFGQANYPTVELENYTFQGWSLTSGGPQIDPSTPILDDITVYPRWIPNDINPDYMIIAHGEGQQQTEEDGDSVDVGNYDYWCEIDTICSPNSTTPIKIHPLEEGQGVDHSLKREDFNMWLTIGKAITFIPDGFLLKCKHFNKKIIFGDDSLDDSQLICVGSAFMYGCESFNEKMSEKTSSTNCQLPNGTKCIYDSFMGECKTFNQPFTFPASLDIVGKDFFYLCQTFNQTIELLQNFHYVGANFMYDCKNFTNTLTVNTPIQFFEVGEGATMSAFSKDDDICKIGFSVAGSEAAAFKNQFPTITPADHPFPIDEDDWVIWRKINS